MATTKSAKVNGKAVEAINASLSPLTFKGYWADTNGVRIDKIPFGSKVRFYTERWQAYNAKLKIYIKSSVKDVPIVEGTIDKLIDGYFTKRELYYEMTLKKLSQYEALRGAQYIELCCDVAKGFGSYGEVREVAKIPIISKCICEIRLRAFMSMLRVGEGTSDNNGYRRIVGGRLFDDYKKDFSDHPRIRVALSKTLQSTAAGAYQIMEYTYDDLGFSKWRKLHNVSDFSPRNQDLCCYWLIRVKRKAMDEIKKGHIKEAIELCRKEWASLPGAGYGQREEGLKSILEKYDNYFSSELNGKTIVNIEKDFLKDLFDEPCVCGCPEKSKSRN